MNANEKEGKSISKSIIPKDVPNTPDSNDIMKITDEDSNWFHCYGITVTSQNKKLKQERPLCLGVMKTYILTEKLSKKKLERMHRHNDKVSQEDSFNMPDISFLGIGKFYWTSRMIRLEQFPIKSRGFKFVYQSFSWKRLSSFSNSYFFQMRRFASNMGRTSMDVIDNFPAKMYRNSTKLIANVPEATSSLLDISLKTLKKIYEWIIN